MKQSNKIINALQEKIEEKDNRRACLNSELNLSLEDRGELAILQAELDMLRARLNTAKQISLAKNEEFEQMIDEKISDIVEIIKSNLLSVKKKPRNKQVEYMKEIIKLNNQLGSQKYILQELKSKLKGVEK